jgi:CBS domain containing-hemolysin-like protein
VFLVQRSAEQGALTGTTAELLRKVLRFDDLRAGDVRTPRTRVTTVSADASLTELLETARSTGRTRFPVVGDTVDDVRGVVSVVDAFAVPAERRDRVRVTEVSAPAFMVPSVLPVDDLLAQLLGRESQLAMVMDEFGGLDGVVTLEDLVEELIGNVVDEHDLDEEPPGNAPGERPPDEPWSVSGLLRPDEVQELTGVQIPDGGQVYETLGGFLMARLGHIPVPGETVDADGWEFTVVEVERRRIEQVRVVAPEPSDDEEGEGL